MLRGLQPSLLEGVTIGKEESLGKQPFQKLHFITQD